ncbi:formylglycine-generating enzyme family protein [Parendozoicomonas haliclonae]|uniref:Serine/threonine-protein kinase pkn1 n=1 Tax=Parendozoicomonas haliclonae TaxID=1960125 RepID=A0A1X7AK80_9GAMM|nr:formylglycine-generating enzyme family protein [Parendozoicomonas haliclonae]SMA47077.1 Serine/threonine-protein kinase pkn1 [Parendozoicomonas haliclonae]
MRTYLKLLLLVAVTALPFISSTSYALDDEAMVRVPAGSFTMGCNHSRQELCDTDTKPAHNVYVDAFDIDKYEVTYRRYKECVANGDCTEPFIGGACNWNFSWNDNHPVNCVDWQQAKTFCEQEGKRLPTELEWEKAARGTWDQRVFPWGDEPASCKYAAMDENGLRLPMPGCGRGTTTPVDHAEVAGASPYGAVGMAGNLWEWTSDWYDPEFYGKPAAKKANTKGPANGTFKTIRGGAWTMRTDGGLASTLRFGYAPKGQGYVIGFRCASSVN